MTVELGHQLAVRGARGGKVVVTLLEFQLQVDHLLFEGRDPGNELFGVVGSADAGLSPYLVTEYFTQPCFEATDLGGETAQPATVPW
ncbi:hypothetical protein [Streptomyces sp. NPDC056255]|uniref:hypothetical protein n=1 Tax=Streptomyces TaxID=1883 RepID=UPI0035DEA3FC